MSQLQTCQPLTNATIKEMVVVVLVLVLVLVPVLVRVLVLVGMHHVVHCKVQ